MNQDTRLSSEERARLIGAIGREVRSQQNAADVFDDVVAERIGLNRTDMRCLDILERLQPMTAGQLARESGLTTGAVTAVLDRLERSGYARRVRDTVDRRRVLVESVPEAIAPVWEFYGPLADWTFAELAQQSDERLEFLLDFMRRGREFLVEHTAGVKEGGKQLPEETP